jgi:hypothetical protein
MSQSLVLEHVHFDRHSYLFWIDVHATPIPPSMTSLILRSLPICLCDIQDKAWFAAFTKQVKVVVGGRKAFPNGERRYHYLDDCDVHPNTKTPPRHFKLKDCPEYNGMVPVAHLGDEVGGSVLQYLNYSQLFLVIDCE